MKNRQTVFCVCRERFRLLGSVTPEYIDLAAYETGGNLIRKDMAPRKKVIRRIYE